MRKTIADTEHIPPYAVFADRTLVEMAAYHPQSLSTIKHIHGVGSVKSERFGEAFLKLIMTYCKDHGLEEVPKRNSSSSPQSSLAASKKPRFDEASEDFISGMSIEDLMKKYDVQNQTVFGYLVKYSKTGRIISNPERFLTFSHVSPTVRKQILQAFKELGSEYLNPVFKRMNETVDFNELRILQLYFVCMQKKQNGGK